MRNDCISQWKYLLPDWVEISERGLDIWQLGEYLDCPSFYTLPADAYGEPNAYTVPCEMAILRSASRQRDLTSGLFLGRYLFGDIYNSCTPAEAIASAFGAGCTDLFFYGYSGLDDGGNFGKWSNDRKESVRSGLNWFSEVREAAGSRINQKQGVILFPDASFMLDNRNYNDAGFRACRNDSLGYYQQLSDLGINADFLHPRQVKEGLLKEYKLLILPSNPLYHYIPDAGLESALRTFAEQGGQIIASASCGFFDCFNITARPHDEDSIIWKETITEYSEAFCSFEGITPIARFGRDDAVALGVSQLGRGKIFVAGLDLGTCYCERRHKPVPVFYGREAHYPLTVLEQTPVEEWVIQAGMSDYIHRGIELVPFENGKLFINHTSYEYILPENSNKAISTFLGFDNKILPGHHSAFLFI